MCPSGHTGVFNFVLPEVSFDWVVQTKWKFKVGWPGQIGRGGKIGGMHDERARVH